MSSENIYRHIPKISCLLCKSEVAINQFDRHHGTKQCLSGGKFTIEYLDSCRYCKVPKLSFDSGRKFAAHVKWCQLNPNRGKGIIDNPNMIGCNHMHTPEVIEKRRKRISEAHKRGAYKEGYIKSGQTRTGKKASDEAKRNISIAAQNSPHQRVCKRSHKFIDKRGREFIFDSSWEDILAIRLDFLDIKWDRPLPISYDMDGKKHRYFPDFYIPSLNLYIDPKNPYCQKQQKQKLDIVRKMINLQILGSKKECVEWRAEQDLNLRPTT